MRAGPSPVGALRRGGAPLLALLCLATMVLPFAFPGAVAVAAAQQPSSTTTTTTTTTGSTTRTPGSSERPAGPSAEPRLELVGQSPTIPYAGGVFELRLRIDGTPPEGGFAVVVDRFSGISNAGADKRDRLDQWARGETPARDPLPSTDPVLVDFLPTDDDGARVLRINTAPTGKPTEQPGLHVSDAGVFPVVVRLVRGADRAATLDRTTTVMVVVPNGRDRPPLQVATVLPLRAGVALRPDGNRRFEDDDARRLSEVRDLLAAHPDVPLSVDALGETIEGLGHVGAGTGPPTAAEVLAALGDRQLLAPTWVDVDVDGWAAAELTAAFDRQRELPDASIRTYLRQRREPETGTFVVRDDVTPEARRLLRESGIERLVVPEDDVAAVDLRRYPRGRGAGADQKPFDLEDPGGAVRAVTADRRLADRLTATDNPVVNAQLALADLVLLACGSDNHCTGVPDTERAVVFVAPEGERARQSLDRLLGLLTDLGAAPGPTPLIQPAALDDVFAIAPALDPADDDRALVRPYRNDPAPVADLGPFAARLGDTTRRLAGFRSMVRETSPTSADLLQQLVEVAGAEDAPGGWAPYLDTVDARIGTAEAGITIPGQEVITLTAEDADLQIRLESSLEYPVTVNLLLSSELPVFPEGRTTVHPVRIEPFTGTTEPVRVQARGSGLFTVDVRVTSPEPGLALGTTRLQVRSAVFSNVGLVLTVGAFIFLLVWWARHFRDARRSRKLVDPDEVAEAAALATGEHRAVTVDEPGASAPVDDAHPVGSHPTDR